MVQIQQFDSREKNSISLEFHANAFNKELHSYKSYVQGKYIDYSPDTINDLLNKCVQFQKHVLFFQTLEASFNSLEFIVEKTLGRLGILNHENVNVEYLMAENIKYMVDAPQRACGNFLYN